MDRDLRSGFIPQKRWVSVGDVLERRRWIANEVLEDCSRPPAPFLGIETGDVDPINGDPALGRTIESE